MSADDRDLERLTRRAVGGLPLLPAPATLEARVSRALALHAAQPWWRRSFAEWPLAARVAFLLVSLGLIDLTVQLGTGARLSAAPAEWLLRGDGLISSIGGFFTLRASLVPTGWLMAALTVGAVLYTALFGLAAVLYRILYLNAPMKGDLPWTNP